MVKKQNKGFDPVELSVEIHGEITSWIRTLISEYDNTNDIEEKINLARNINRAFKTYIKLLKTPIIRELQTRGFKSEIPRMNHG